MRPHRRQPTRLPRPRDSPGKNTGVGCHLRQDNHSNVFPNISTKRLQLVQIYLGHIKHKFFFYFSGPDSLTYDIVGAFQVALVANNPPANEGNMRHGFDPWMGKIPWRRAWQPTPVFLPGEEYWSILATDRLHRIRHNWSDLTHTWYNCITGSETAFCDRV